MIIGGQCQLIQQPNSYKDYPKEDNGYLCEIIGVSGVVHPQTQLIDALIES